MQFSLKFLMAFALLCALVVSGLVASRTVNLHRARSEVMKAEIHSLTRDVGNFEMKVLHFSRYTKANEKRVREFSVAEAKVRNILEKHSQLSVADPERFYIRELPSLPEEDIVKWRWRIHVPEGIRLELATDFIEEKKNSTLLTSNDEGRVLKNARLFNPGELIRFDLPSGQSVIAVEWRGGFEKSKNLVLTVDGVEVYVSRFLDQADSFSTHHEGIAGQEERSLNQPFQPLLLCSFLPSVKDSEFRERFWLRILPKRNAEDEGVEEEGAANEK